MMDFNFAFSPELPLWFILPLAIVSGLMVVFGLIRGIRGAWIRAIAWLLVMLALLNPAALLEEREPLKSVVAVISDVSGSQQLDGRAETTQAVRQSVMERLGGIEEFEIRNIEAGDFESASSDISTALFRVLRSALQDVPPDRVAGAVMITDGQVHDIPDSLDDIGISAPLHALITGQEDERDRRIIIESAPRYGVVGESFEVEYSVAQQGFGNSGEPLEVSIYADGELLAVEDVAPGRQRNFVSEVPHGGKNILEFRVEADDGEITDINNRAFVTINGIRDNLRVLLVSGEPHAGERTWRNLLKSDPSVDLVHFTILRPPEKQDGTPINQLSLIAFPTRELFVQKIDEFDLIIFDRYRRRGVLPILYFENIARYVRDGGALLIAAGPELGESGSIAGPLDDIMPARPSGNNFEAPFKPLVSEEGLKHPVTRNLDGWREGKPQWGSWFRVVGSEQVSGNVVMTGENEQPLLVLERADEGRIALFLSDHPWLWARGFEGGGPHVQLLRRAAHWLMKEPELDEERLTANSDGQRVIIERQSLGDAPGSAMLSGPAENTINVPLVADGPGLWRGEVEVDNFGLYTAVNGDLRALTHVGPPNPREFTDVISTPALLEPVAEASGGSVRRIDTDGLPRIIPVREGANSFGRSWIGFENTQSSVLTGIDRLALFSGLLGLAMLVTALAAMWTREGR
jgi:hypothetical protein